MAEPLLVAAPILNIQIFLLGIFGLLALLVAVSLLHRHPTRVCPQCGQKVRLDHWRCPTCRYRFSHFLWR